MRHQRRLDDLVRKYDRGGKEEIEDERLLRLRALQTSASELLERSEREESLDTGEAVGLLEILKTIP